MSLQQFNAALREALVRGGIAAPGSSLTLTIAMPSASRQGNYESTLRSNPDGSLAYEYRFSDVIGSVRCIRMDRCWERNNAYPDQKWHAMMKGDVHFHTLTVGGFLASTPVDPATSSTYDISTTSDRARTFTMVTRMTDAESGEALETTTISRVRGRTLVTEVTGTTPPPHGGDFRVDAEYAFSDDPVLVAPPRGSMTGAPSRNHVRIDVYITR